MADLHNEMTARHWRAVDDLETLAMTLGAQRLAPKELAGFGSKDMETGWRFPVTFSTGVELTLAILVPTNVPFGSVRIGVIGAPPLGTLPHVTEHGLLCVFPEGASFSSTDAAGVAETLLARGIELLEEALTGGRDQDFRDEFVSYWTSALVPDVLALIEPDGRSRTVSTWMTNERLFVGENDEQLREWLDRSYGVPKPGKKRIFSSGLLVWPSQVPTPMQFPSSGPDLYSLLAGDDSALTLLGGFLRTQAGTRDVILGMHTATGIGFGALRVGAARVGGAPGRPINQIEKGFRPGTLPPRVLAQRALAPSVKIERRLVRRADHAWVHGRDHDASQSVLREKRVVAVGAGSLGSTVIELLAKSGIPNVNAVDPAVLGYENIARHALGASSVRRHKASDLMEKLTRDFPHLNGLKSSVAAFGHDLKTDLARVNQADLIVITTGDWASESFLSALQDNGLPVPVLYAWVEPHAMAAQVVYVPPTGKRFTEGMTSTGRPLLAATSWPDDGIHQIPACGGAFTPYGAADLAWAHALVASEVTRWLLRPAATSVHKIWLGETARIAELGGSVTPEWLAAFGDPGPGGFVRECEWPTAGSVLVGRRAA